MVRMQPYFIAFKILTGSESLALKVTDAFIPVSKA